MKLYQITHDGFIVDYWAGFTTVVGVKVDDEGRIYVLELSSAAGFPDIGKGRILRITGTTVEEIVSGLNVPTGMTLDRNGDIYVSDLGALPVPSAVFCASPIRFPARLSPTSSTQSNSAA